MAAAAGATVALAHRIRIWAGPARNRRGRIMGSSVKVQSPDLGPTPRPLQPALGRRCAESDRLILSPKAPTYLARIGTKGAPRQRREARWAGVRRALSRSPPAEAAIRRS